MKNRLFFRRASGKPELTLRSCCSRFALVTILSLLVSFFIVPTLMVGATGSSDYVMTYCEDTPFGLRYIPELTDWSLEANPSMQTFMTNVQDALAEQDANIADILGEFDSEEWGGGASNQSAIFSTYISYHDDLLSLVVRYTPLTPGEPYQYHMFSLNLDLTDGAELSLEDVLSRGDCTLDDVEFSIREISRQCMERDSDRMALVNGALESRMPDFASLGYDDGIVENTLDDCVNNFRAAVQGYENDYGIVPDDSYPPFHPEDFSDLLEYCLDHFNAYLEDRPDSYGQPPEAPALAYTDHHRVFLSAFLPSMAGAGYWECVIPIVRTPDQATALAFWDLFGNKVLATEPLSGEAALAAAMRSFAVDENGVTADGVPLTFALSGMQTLELYEEEWEPCYLVEAYEDHPDHKSNYGWRVVSAFTGSVLDYDPVMDEWNYLEDNMTFEDGDPIMDAQNHHAAAVLYTDFDAYDEWLTRPHFTANLPEICQDDSATDTVMCCVMVVEPDSQIAVIGTQDQVLYSEELQVGESLLVIYPYGAENPYQIRIQNNRGRADYALAALKDQMEPQVYLKYAQ